VKWLPPNPLKSPLAPDGGIKYNFRRNDRHRLQWPPDRLREISVSKIAEEIAEPYILEKLVLDLNGIEPVPAYFVRPRDRKGRLPVVLYNHAHGGNYELGKDELWGMMVYDSLRALDYLASRPDVDADRLGTMGISMGSTMAWWVAALDTRIKVCIDICCLTDFHTLIESRGLDGTVFTTMCPICSSISQPLRSMPSSLHALISALPGTMTG